MSRFFWTLNWSLILAKKKKTRYNIQLISQVLGRWGSPHRDWLKFLDSIYIYYYTSYYNKCMSRIVHACIEEHVEHKGTLNMNVRVLDPRTCTCWTLGRVYVEPLNVRGLNVEALDVLMRWVPTIRERETKSWGFAGGGALLDWKRGKGSCLIGHSGHTGPATAEKDL